MGSRWLRAPKSYHGARLLIFGGVWICVIVLALIHMPIPLTGDQALYMYGAKTLAKGQALYLDFWDAKQPGVYFFYLLAGWLFGFSETGLHATEALWFLIAGWCAYRLGACARPEGIAPLVIPLLSVGTYFVAVGAWHMAQPDGLVATPLVASAWALCDRQVLARWPTRLLISGLCAGVAATFLIGTLIVPLALLLTLYVIAKPDPDRPMARRPTAQLVIWMAGVAIPIVAVIAWFASSNALTELIWTTFHYPVDALEQLERYPEGLRVSVRWFAEATYFWTPFALVGAVWSVRELFRRNEAARPGALMLVWLVAGATTVLLQYQYWWAFHLNQFFLPVGVLAGIGLGVVLDLARPGSPRWASRAAVASIALAGVLFAGRVGSKIFMMAAALDGTTSVRSAYAALFDPGSIGMEESARTALRGKEDGAIYVFGDPRILLASGRRQAVPHNGWALEIMTSDQWSAFSLSLKGAAPRYIYVSRTYSGLLTERAPELLRWLTNNYDLFQTDSASGRWFQARTL